MVFYINNRKWEIKKVCENSTYIRTDDDTIIGGITNFIKSTIYINEELENDLMKDTILHELAHAYIFVYGLPQYDSYSEENVCDMFGSFGLDLTTNALDIFTKWQLN